MFNDYRIEVDFIGFKDELEKRRERIYLFIDKDKEEFPTPNNNRFILSHAEQIESRELIAKSALINDLFENPKEWADFRVRLYEDDRLQIHVFISDGKIYGLENEWLAPEFEAWIARAEKELIATPSDRWEIITERYRFDPRSKFTQVEKALYQRGFMEDGIPTFGEAHHTGIEYSKDFENTTIYVKIYNKSKPNDFSDVLVDTWAHRAFRISNSTYNIEFKSLPGRHYAKCIDKYMDGLSGMVNQLYKIDIPESERVFYRDADD